MIKPVNKSLLNSRMPNMKKPTVKEAIRVVGHLLETNGTTKVFARNSKGKQVETHSPKACKFCLSGACDLVAVNVLGIAKDDYDSLCDFENRVSGLIEKKFRLSSESSYIKLWDTANFTQREAIIETLKNV